MDFDHRDPTEKRFNLLQRAGDVSQERLLAELAKCDIVCANCHRSRTYAHATAAREARKRAEMITFGRARAMRSRRAQVDLDLLQRLREGATCPDCGGRFPYYLFEFDHRVPTEKSFGVVESAGRYPQATLLEESKKCDIVCVNCHRVRPAARREAARASVARGSACL